MNTFVNDPEHLQSVLITTSPLYISIIKISRSYQKVLGTKLKHENSSVLSAARSRKHLVANS